MECPKIIKTAILGTVAKSVLIGAGIGSAGAGALRIGAGYRKYKKERPKLSLKQYLEKDKKEIGRSMRGGAIFGGMIGGIKVHRKLLPVTKGSIGFSESYRLLGLDNMPQIKHKSQVLRSFRDALMMHHANKPGKIKILKDIKKGIAWEPGKVVNALKTIQKTDWYSKLAFSR